MRKIAQTSLSNRITRIWFAVLTAGLVAFTLLTIQDGLCEGDRCGETLLNDNDVGMLKKASALIERERGDTNQPSPEWLVFQKFLKFGKLGKGAITELLEKATPAGRLYAVILLNELDPAESTKVLNKMATQSDKVDYIRGCCVETTTVGALAKRIIKGDKLVVMPNAKDAPAKNTVSLDQKKTIDFSVGYQLKPFCKYEKKGADITKLCKNLKEDQISFDEFLGVNISKLDQKSRWAYQRGMPTVVGTKAAVILVLRKSKAVTSHDWHHNYHHVAQKDQHGYITRSDGTKIIWMLRPGGLGVLVYPDGGTIFIAETGGLNNSSTMEQDILETVAKNPLGAQVKAKDGSWKPAKYGDPKLAEAVEYLIFIAKPWTVPSIIQNYHKLKGKNDQACAHLLRVLAASRDPRAAAVLGPALSDSSLSIRVAATYGIMDYFMDHMVNGGTEQHMEAAQQWWNKQQLKK